MVPAPDPLHNRRHRRRRRRALTRRVARQRRALHLARLHPDGAVDCPCELAGTWFARRSALGCNCRRRRRGQPRQGRGVCGIGARDAIYRDRCARRRCRDLLLAGADEDDLDPLGLLPAPRARRFCR